MEILPHNLLKYLDNHCDQEPELLQAINRETYLTMLKPHMLSGHYQGRLLSFLSKMIQPKLILEVGTFTGYSTICLAEGLSEDGEIHTIEANHELEETLKTNFKTAGLEKKIKLYLGQAEQILNDFTYKDFDLVFIDADKKNNFTYFGIAFD